MSKHNRLFSLLFFQMQIFPNYFNQLSKKSYKNEYDYLTARFLEEQLSYDVIINSLKAITKSDIFK